ncbi:hypothetical protein [Buchananella felis]|uniref:hypothetical protein n=1 Tax=Buchananella felis TaxID=3231492 RepID=UPI003526EB5D
MRVHLHAIASSAAAAAEVAAAAAQGWGSVALDTVTTSCAAATWPSPAQPGAYLADAGSGGGPALGGGGQAISLTPRGPAPVPRLEEDVELVVAVTPLVDHNTGGPLDPSNLTALAAAAAELAVPLVVIAGRCEAARREYASVPIHHVLSLSVDDVRPADGKEDDVSPAAALQAAARIARTWSTGERVQA